MKLQALRERNCIIPHVRTVCNIIGSSSAPGFWLERSINVDDTNHSTYLRFFYNQDFYSEVKDRPDTRYSFERDFTIIIIVLPVFSYKNSKELQVKSSTDGLKHY